MKTLDKFLLKDILKSIRKCDVAYYLDDIQPYHKALASTRMRCYDVINWLEKKGVKAELYKPFKKYKVVFFVKVHSDKSVRLAQKLHDTNTVLIMEPFCDFLDDEARKDDPERINVLKLTENMDIIDACSGIQQQMFAKYHSRVNFVGDSVNDEMFQIQKKVEPKQKVTLIYCGYGKKVRDTLCIADVIRKLQEKYNCEVLFLTNEEPDITEFQWKYLKYDQSKVAEQFCLGDIMIAPRPMEGIEQLSHSNTKIAYPMSVGLPVVASPVPSYLDSPALLCRTDEEWYQALEKLILDADYRRMLGEEGRKFMWENYSMEHIGKQYLDMIRPYIM